MLNITKLEKIAKENGKSFSYLSEKVLHRYRTYLKDVKSNNAKIDDESIETLANALDTTFEYLTDQTDKKEKPDVNVELSEKEKRILDIIRTLSPEDVNRLEAIADSLRRLK